MNRLTFSSELLTTPFHAFALLWVHAPLPFWSLKSFSPKTGKAPLLKHLPSYKAGTSLVLPLHPAGVHSSSDPLYLANVVMSSDRSALSKRSKTFWSSSLS